MSRKVKNVNPLITKIFKENDIQNIADAQDLMKDMFKIWFLSCLKLKWMKPLDIPRDRNGSFESPVIPKYSRDISDIEDKIISMHGRGMSTKDINTHLEEIYGMSFSSI